MAVLISKLSADFQVALLPGGKSRYRGRFSATSRPETLWVATDLLVDLDFFRRETFTPTWADRASSHRWVAWSIERMYAIFEDGSHQFRVSEGERVVVDRRDGERGSEIVFSKVLLIAGEGAPQIGAPVLEGARVTAKVIEQFRDKKIIIQKFRRRKNMRRRNGHRQPHTAVMITGITLS